jgi:GT2 family glycosyltransferase
VVAYVLGHGELAPDFVREAVAALARTGADAVGGPIETRGDGAWGRAIAAALSSPFGVGGARFRYSQRESEVDTVAFAAYRRDVFDRIGGFDENMAGDEDGDFHARLRAAGGRILLSPRIHAVYHARGSLAALARQYLAFGAAKARTARRHGDTLRAYHLAPAGLVLTGIAAAAGPHPLRRLARAGLAAYAAVSVLASAARLPDLGPSIALRLPAVFAAIHLSYGAGWLLGSTGVWAPGRR